MSKRELIWIVPYLLSLIVHLSWVVWGIFLTENLLGVKEVSMQYCIVFGTWVVIVILSSGCPFTYLHQWLEIQAGWRKGLTYKFEDCILHKYLIRPAWAVIKPNINRK